MLENKKIYGISRLSMHTTVNFLCIFENFRRKGERIRETHCLLLKKEKVQIDTYKCFIFVFVSNWKIKYIITMKILNRASDRGPKCAHEHGVFRNQKIPTGMLKTYGTFLKKF